MKRTMRSGADFVFYVSVGAGMALATSVFTMIAGLFAVASTPWIVLSVVLAGLVCAAISLSVGELASIYPSAPGIRTYYKAAFGEAPSLMAVYLYLAFAILVAGLESFVFASVVEMAAPSVPQASTVVMLLIVVVVTNLSGFQLPRSLQIVTTVGAFALVLGVSIWAIVQHSPATATSTTTTAAPAIDAGMLEKLPALVGMSIFLYAGFEWVTPLGLKPTAYRRQIPLSMLIGLLILMLAYAAFVVGASTQVPSRTLAESIAPQVLLFQKLLGPIGVFAGLLLSILAIFSTFNAGILGGSQLIYLLGRDGALPSWCAVLSARSSTPTAGILILGSLATMSSMLVLAFRLEIAVALVGAAIMCGVYSGFILCGLKLDVTRVPASRRFANPLPRWCQFGLAAALPIVGVQTLLSEASVMWTALAGMVLTLAIAGVLTAYSMSARPRRVERSLPGAEP